MSANICGKAYGIGTTKIYESYSVCSFRTNAARECCTNLVQGYQCWNFCAVPEADFKTWFACAENLNATTRSGTLEARCQRADESPLLTEKGPYPASFSQPRPPESYYSRTYSAESHARATGTLVARHRNTTKAADDKAATNSSTTATIATPTGKTGSAKALEFSVGGIVCVFLALSTLVL